MREIKVIAIVCTFVLQVGCSFSFDSSDNSSDDNSDQANKQTDLPDAMFLSSMLPSGATLVVAGSLQKLRTSSVWPLVTGLASSSFSGTAISGQWPTDCGFSLGDIQNVAIGLYTAEPSRQVLSKKVWRESSVPKATKPKGMLIPDKKLLKQEGGTNPKIPLLILDGISDTILSCLVQVAAQQNGTVHRKAMSMPGIYEYRTGSKVFWMAIQKDRILLAPTHMWLVRLLSQPKGEDDTPFGEQVSHLQSAGSKALWFVSESAMSGMGVTSGFLTLGELPQVSLLLRYAESPEVTEDEIPGVKISAFTAANRLRKDLPLLGIWAQSRGLGPIVQDMKVSIEAKSVVITKLLSQNDIQSLVSYLGKSVDKD